MRKIYLHKRFDSFDNMVSSNINSNPFMPSFGRIPPMVLDQRSVMDNYLLRLNLGDAKYQTSLV